MKTNKEFIEGIYKKVDEISEQKKLKNRNIIEKISTLAAVILVALVIGINFNTKQTQEQNGKKENIENNPEPISLQTVNTFENFYNIIKNSNIQLINTNGSYSDALVTEEAGATLKYSSSKTNNQVENVDEGDIVKVNDNYIYYKTNKKLVIIDAKEASQSQKVGEINFEEEEFYPEQIYVNNNKLIIIARIYFSAIGNITYHDVILSEDTTFLLVYDISNKAEPKQIRKIEIEGNCISSRMIGNSIYFATNKSIYSSEIKNSEIEALDETKYMPKYSDSLISEEQKCIAYDNIYCFENIETTNYLILGAINLESQEEVKLQTFLGGGNFIYCSEENMYIAKSKREYTENHELKSSSTHILKFALHNGNITFSAEANIEGVINNQFSMDENGEYFRIATTSGLLWETTQETSNNLFILNEKLELVGKVTGFGVSEKIYSVRYVGTKAYVVTFKQTDPLFVIDLTEPTNPTILGELKIPGYSTYLHPYDETHIIGFGYDTKEDGTRITTNGLKMVMFDVSDLNNPKELFKVEIGDQYTSSELTYNHKALLYSKEKNILAFPLNTYQKGGSYTRAAIYQVDLENGFILKGEISHEYTNNQRIVERIVYVNNIYYTLSKSLIKASDMETLQVIKEIEI